MEEYNGVKTMSNQRQTNSLFSRTLNRIRQWTNSNSEETAKQSHLTEQEHEEEFSWPIEIGERNVTGVSGTGNVSVSDDELDETFVGDAEEAMVFESEHGLYYYPVAADIDGSGKHGDYTLSKSLGSTKFRVPAASDIDVGDVVDVELRQNRIWLERVDSAEDQLKEEAEGTTDTPEPTVPEIEPSGYDGTKTCTVEVSSSGHSSRRVDFDPKVLENSMLSGGEEAVVVEEEDSLHFYSKSQLPLNGEQRYDRTYTVGDYKGKDYITLTLPQKSDLFPIGKRARVSSQPGGPIVVHKF